MFRVSCENRHCEKKANVQLAFGKIFQPIDETDLTIQINSKFTSQKDEINIALTPI